MSCIIITVDVISQGARCSGVIRALDFTLAYNLVRKRGYLKAMADMRVREGIRDTLVRYLRAQRASSVTVRPSRQLDGRARLLFEPLSEEFEVTILGRLSSSRAS